jgi:hypothetical protein
MAEIGTAYVTLLPSAKGFVTELERQLGGSGTKPGTTAAKGFKSSFTKGVAGIGAGLAGMFAISKVKDFFTSAVGEARESQKVSAITAQVIKSTGGAAQVSAKQVGDLATSISNKTGIDDEAIQSASNLLLTFKNLRNETGQGNDMFDQATLAATDLAAALGKEPRSAAIQLGKAMNDPTKGITALSRAGIQFDATQTKTIQKMQKSGNIMGAQKIILKELKTQTGGAAEASSTAGEKMETAWNNVKESLGTQLLPVIDKVEGFITNKVLPAVSKFIEQFRKGKGAGGEFKDALLDTWDALKKAWSILQPIGTWLVNNIPLVLAVAAAFGVWRLAVLAYNIVQAIQLAMLMLVTPGTMLYAVGAGIAAVATTVWAAAVWLLTTPLGLIVLAILALIVVVILVIKYHKQIGAFIGKVWGKIKDAIGKAVDWVVGFVKKHWGLLLAIIAGPLGLIVGLVIKNWDKIKDFIGKSIDGIVKFIMGIPGKIASLGSKILAIGKTIGSKLIDGFFSGIRAVGGLVTDLATSIKGAINGALNLPFTIKGPGPLPDFTIPAFAQGGRVKGSVILAGENGWESIIPDKMMVEALTAAAMAGQAQRPSEPYRDAAPRSNRLRLVVDGYEFNAYVDDRADAVVASAGALQDERSRASWR